MRTLYFLDEDAVLEIIATFLTIPKINMIVYFWYEVFIAPGLISTSRFLALMSLDPRC